MIILRATGVIFCFWKFYIIVHSVSPGFRLLTQQRKTFEYITSAYRGNYLLTDIEMFGRLINNIK